MESVNVALTTCVCGVVAVLYLLRPTFLLHVFFALPDVVPTNNHLFLLGLAANFDIVFFVFGVIVLLRPTKELRRTFLLLCVLNTAVVDASALVYLGAGYFVKNLLPLTLLGAWSAFLLLKQ